MNAIWDSIFLFSSLWVSVTKPLANVPLYFNASLEECLSLKKKAMIDWLPPLVDSVKLNFGRCSMGNPGQIGVLFFIYEIKVSFSFF